MCHPQQPLSSLQNSTETNLPDPPFPHYHYQKEVHMVIVAVVSLDHIMVIMPVKMQNLRNHLEKIDEVVVCFPHLRPNHVRESKMCTYRHKITTLCLEVILHQLFEDSLKSIQHFPIFIDQRERR
jgi:hypothetical protein